MATAPSINLKRVMLPCAKPGEMARLLRWLWNLPEELDYTFNPELEIVTLDTGAPRGIPLLRLYEVDSTSIISVPGLELQISVPKPLSMIKWANFVQYYKLFGGQVSTESVANGAKRLQMPGMLPNSLLMQVSDTHDASWLSSIKMPATASVAAALSTVFGRYGGWKTEGNGIISPDLASIEFSMVEETHNTLGTSTQLSFEVAGIEPREVVERLAQWLMTSSSDVPNVINDGRISTLRTSGLGPVTLQFYPMIPQKKTR